MNETVKVLFLSSNPKDISRVRLDEELREVDERIRLGDCRDKIELIPHFAVRTRDVAQALLRHRPHILHFSGHGSPADGIILEDKNGMTKFVSAEALAGLLSVIRDNLRVVVLNACYSGLQAEAIRQVVEGTVGMQKAIGDQSAIEFSAAFYEGLAFGRNLHEAFGLGVSALMMNYPSESNTPVLLMKEGVSPSETYLVQQARSAEPTLSGPGSKKIIVTDSDLKAGENINFSVS
jgi:CHAT domain